MMVLVNPPDLLIEIPVWQNYSQVHKILFSKDLDFISFFHNQQSKVGTAFLDQSKVYGPRLLNWRVHTTESRRTCIKLDGPKESKWTVSEMAIAGPKG